MISKEQLDAGIEAFKSGDMSGEILCDMAEEAGWLVDKPFNDISTLRQQVCNQIKPWFFEEWSQLRWLQVWNTSGRILELARNRPSEAGPKRLLGPFAYKTALSKASNTPKGNSGTASKGKKKKPSAKNFKKTRKAK